jgi:formylglycine-generating enzyme required for sulfatase activity
VVAGAGLLYGRRWAVGGNAPPRPPVTNSVGLQLVWIPAGTFTMGSPPGEPERRQDEEPLHVVTISQPFYMAAHETTVAQFRAFVQATHYQTGAEKDSAGAPPGSKETGSAAASPAGTWRKPGWVPADEEPVVCVSRYDALAFCYWLSRKEGKSYRLPTEAEWEYACRAGTSTPFAGGPVLLAEQARFASSPSSPERPTRVGSFAPNAWGLYDMHGNAWEWCADQYSSTAYSDSPGRDPRGPERGELGVLRGGSWRSGSGDCRCAARLGAALGSGRSDVGFRVVLESGVR